MDHICNRNNDATVLDTEVWLWSLGRFSVITGPVLDVLSSRNLFFAGFDRVQQYTIWASGKNPYPYRFFPGYNSRASAWWSIHFVFTILFFEEQDMNSSLGRPVFCFLAIMTIYAVYGYAKGHPVYLILQEYRYPLYFTGTYFAALYLFNTRLKLQVFLKLTILSGAVAAMILVFKVFSGANAAIYAEVRPFDLPKNIIFDMVLVLLSFNFYTSSFVNRWISYFLVPIGLLALIVSFTRKLWIVAILILTFFLFLYLYQAFKIRRGAFQRFLMVFSMAFSLFLTFGIVVFLLPNIFDLIVSRYVESLTLHDMSIQNRLVYIVEPLKYSKSLYFMGTGLGFDVLFFNPERLSFLLSRGITKSTYMENGYVYFILKTGIFGFIIFSWMMLKGIATAFAIFRRTEDGFFRGTSLWLISYLIIILVAGNFDQSFNNFMAAPSIAVHLSLIEHLRQRSKVKAVRAHVCKD